MWLQGKPLWSPWACDGCLELVIIPIPMDTVWLQAHPSECGEAFLVKSLCTFVCAGAGACARTYVRVFSNYFANSRSSLSQEQGSD